MPLTFTGAMFPTEVGVTMRAINGAGEPVVVKSSQEAIDDYGLGQVQSVASEKYDAGKVEADGTVSVRTSDFR